MHGCILVGLGWHIFFNLMTLSHFPMSRRVHEPCMPAATEGRRVEPITTLA